MGLKMGRMSTAWIYYVLFTCHLQASPCYPSCTIVLAEILIESIPALNAGPALGQLLTLPGSVSMYTALAENAKG